MNFGVDLISLSSSSVHPYPFVSALLSLSVKVADTFESKWASKFRLPASFYPVARGTTKRFAQGHIGETEHFKGTKVTINFYKSV